MGPIVFLVKMADFVFPNMESFQRIFFENVLFLEHSFF